MQKMVVLFLVLMLSVFDVNCDQIETPDFDPRNKFAIDVPSGWGYRTFSGENGLVAVLWPADTSFNRADTVAFVFVQNSDTMLPDIPDNINLFKEKCGKADFKFALTDDDVTQSLSEKYFTGRCGRTMILFEERIENYTVILAFVSAKNVSKSQLMDIKTVVASYKKEIEQYLHFQKSTSMYDE